MPTFTETVADSLVLADSGSSARSAVPRQIRPDSRDRYLSDTVYMLKQSRPTGVVWHKITYDNVDLDTGQKTISVESLQVRRAVLLDESLQSTFARFLSLSKLLAEAGLNEMNVVTILIDRKDVPRNWGPPNTEDYFVVGDSRFQPKLVKNLGNRVFIAVCAETVGQPMVRVERAYSPITLEDSADGTTE